VQILKKGRKIFWGYFIYLQVSAYLMHTDLKSFGDGHFV
jgi:hypothetical protein